jgi:hypothetical protein
MPHSLRVFLTSWYRYKFIHLFSMFIVHIMDRYLAKTRISARCDYASAGKVASIKSLLRISILRLQQPMLHIECRWRQQSEVENE